jgi:hypothetical protein
VGTFVTIASLSDGFASSSTAFNVSVTVSSPPVLTPISSVTMPAGGTQTVNLVGTDPAGLALTYSATAQSQLFYLKSTLGLYQDAGGLYTNFRGQGEKYLRGKVSFDNYTNQGTDYWYYLLPDGNLYEFTPSYTNPSLVGALVAQVGTAVYSNPALLTGATNSSVPLNLSVAGNQLTLSTPSGVAGTFVVTVTASDGTLSSSDNFLVNVHAGDQAPVIAPIANQSIPVIAAELLPIQVSDADGDTLTVTATAESQLFYLKSTLGLYDDAGGFYTNFRGQNEKYLRGKGSFDNYTNQGTDYWYYLLPNGNLYEFTPSYANPNLVGALVAQLGTAVYNNPALLTGATNTAVPLSLSPTTTNIGIAPLPPTTGTFVVIVTVSDGLDSSSDAFTVTVTPLT